MTHSCRGTSPTCGEQVSGPPSEPELAPAYRITGPSRPLRGVVRVPGCKNSAMPALVAAALAPGTVRVDRVPNISDIRNLVEILRGLGADPAWEGDAVVFGPSLDRGSVIPDSLSSQLRGSVYALALAVVRSRNARIGRIGGDSLLGRSLEPHLRALAGFGLSVAQRSDGWEITDGPARPREFVLDDRGITATGLAILIAAGLDGESVIRHASVELETDDILDFVRALGASAERDGRTLVVRGPLSGGSGEFTVPPDQIVWGTFAIASAITGGELEAHGPVAARSGAIVEVLEQAGVTVVHDGNTIRTRGAATAPFRVATGDYPEFPSDLLPQLMVMASQCEGCSEMVERIYDHRFDHAEALRALGVRIEVDGRTARIRGRSSLEGKTLRGTGIRETTSLVLAGLIAEGVSEVHGAGAVHRGYENLAADLRAMGAEIEAVSPS